MTHKKKGKNMVYRKKYKIFGFIFFLLSTYTQVGLSRQSQEILLAGKKPSAFKKIHAPLQRKKCFNHKKDLLQS